MEVDGSNVGVGAPPVVRVETGFMEPKHPLVVWTDHKNLAHTERAEHLNPRQASCLRLHQVQLTLS